MRARGSPRRRRRGSRTRLDARSRSSPVRDDPRSDPRTRGTGAPDANAEKAITRLPRRVKRGNAEMGSAGRTSQPARRAWPCTRARRGTCRRGPRRRSSGSSRDRREHRTAHRRGCVVWHRRLIRLPETSSVKTSGRKRRTSRAEIHSRFSSQRVLLTAAPRRFFMTSIGGRSRTRFRAVSTGVKESGLRTRFARHFSPGARTQRHLPPWSGELLFTGMTDWKQVGRGKPTVRDFASPRRVRVARSSRSRASSD